jgi:cysteine desulfurase
MRVYFDHNATSPLKPAAREAMVAALGLANASSVHSEGRAARAAVEGAREMLGCRLDVHPSMIVFTSGGTEANNLAVRGTQVERLVISSIEHPSVAEAARARDVVLDFVPVNGLGVVDLEGLDSLLDSSPLPTLVSVMLANNETGVIQPVARVAEICRAHGALVHTDAIQALGKIEVRFPELGVDLMTISAHKLGGPKGVGALVVKNGVTLSPQLSGGGQELRRRAGTENVAAIAGFAAALKENQQDSNSLRDELEKRLQELSPQLVIFGRPVERLPNTSCFALPGMAADTVLINLDLAGIAVSTGSACASGRVARSHVLDAMGIEPKLSGAAIRASLGWNTTKADIDTFVAAWRGIIERASRIAA